MADGLEALLVLEPAAAVAVLCETLPLGERRIMSVVQVGQERFLLGVTSGSLAMLAMLPGSEPSSADPENQEFADDKIPNDEIPTWAWRNGSLIPECKSTMAAAEKTTKMKRWITRSPCQARFAPSKTCSANRLRK